MLLPARWGSWGFFSKKRQIFVRQISIHRGKFSRDFAKSGKPPPSPRAISLVRLRRGQAICRLAQLARFLIRNGAGRGERARISGRFAELTLRGCRLSPNRRSLLFRSASRAAFSTWRCLFCPAVPDLTVYTQIFSRIALWAGKFSKIFARCARRQIFIQILENPQLPQI